MVCNLKRIDQTLFYCIMCRQVNKKYYEDIDGHLNYSLPDSPLVWIYARDKNVPLFPAPTPRSSTGIVSRSSSVKSSHSLTTSSFTVQTELHVTVVSGNFVYKV